MKKYLTCTDEKSNKFWQIEVIGNAFHVNYGKIGTQGQTQTKTFDNADQCNKEAEKLIAEKLKKGYKEENSQKKVAQKEKSSTQQKSEKKLVQSRYKIITAKEAEERFQLSVKGYINNSVSQKIEPTETILLFEEEATINGNLELITGEMPENAVGYIVQGNLNVTGRILDGDTDYGPFLVVLGDVYADSITTSGAELYILGNAHIEKFVYTYYNHGSLIITGNLKTKLFICDDHSTEVKGKIDAIIVDDGGNLGVASDFDSDNWNKLFKKQIIAEESIDCDVLMEYIEEGKNFLAKKFETLFDSGVTIEKLIKKDDHKQTALAQKAIAELIASGKKAVELSLYDKKLTALPDNLFELTSLKKLNLSCNPFKILPAKIKELVNLEELDLTYCRLKTLPKELGELYQLKKLTLTQNNFEYFPAELKNLTQLEELNIDSCGLDEFPEVVTQLTNLKRLNISQNYGLSTISDAIGNLTNLKILDINNNPCLPLPQSMCKLQKLEKLCMFTCGTDDYEAIDFPEVLTKLSSLKILIASHIPFKTIPETINQLTKLEILELDSSLGHISSFPNLSKLINLKKLRVSGSEGAIGIYGIFSASQALIKDFFTAPNLEELCISDYGETRPFSIKKDELDYLIEHVDDILTKKTYKDSPEEELCYFIKERGKEGALKYYNAKKGVLKMREKLMPENLKGISQLENLRILTLANNGLKSLPEEIYKLKQLREFPYFDMGNSISKKDINDIIISTKPTTVPAEAWWDDAKEKEWALGEYNQQRKSIGYWQWWYPNGARFGEANYNNKGLLEGSYKRFHPDGTVSQEGTYHKGLAHGWISYYRSEHETTERSMDGVMEDIWHMTIRWENNIPKERKYFLKNGDEVDAYGNPISKSNN